MKPVILAGSPALSPFRTDELKNKITEETGLVIERIEATEVFFLEIKEEPDSGQREKIHSLLGAAGPFGLAGGFFVTPRMGTISPWSSKATDIFHNCGIMQIARVEHGLYYRLTAADGTALPAEQTRPVLPFLYDRMTEGVYETVDDIFAHQEPAPLVTVDILGQGRDALAAANRDMGLAINEEEIGYLYETYKKMDRNPTDVELVMFGQVNSEHCRHKIFNASWVVDGEAQDRSLFAMIRNTHEKHPDGTLVAYKDNSAVIEGGDRSWFEVSPDGSRKYAFRPTQQDIILKVETHNHPTAISPYPGAATGVGGEIRDESATGTGSKSKAGMAGFIVSNLRVPGFKQPWEKDYAPFPSRLASPLAIMTEGPIGGARFGNEFGRPQLFGFFRTYEDRAEGVYRGYHKPIMIAGGMGNIKRIHAHKKDIPPSAYIIQIGGPAMRIGLGGGAASSMATGSNAEDLDFNSVQRDNAEVERRCQEVIDACIALDDANPILSIHDIGAGGLSNGCPELVEAVGGSFKLRAIHNEELSMSPMEIWCNESQERYVLAVAAADLDRFLALCTRERCPAAVLGEATGDGHLSLYDEHFDNKPIDMDLQVLLGHPPKMERNVTRRTRDLPRLDLTGIDMQDAAGRIMRLPAVAKKTFLITIADRSITGLVTRDQMTGPWQEPVADVAVTASTLNASTGEAMAMGERTPLALINAPASGRMAIGEALTNIAAADIGSIGNIKLSANWMCACGEDGEDADLFDTVRAVGMELCPQLGIAIPVGKDSLSMRTLWQTPDGRDEKMVAPLSLIISAFAPVADVRNTITPDLKAEASVLLLADLGHRKNRLGGSCLAQVYNQVGNGCPDLDNPQEMADFFAAVQELVKNGLLAAYHDRSDGGLFACAAEMAMAGRRGVRLNIEALDADPFKALFAEELGAVLQVKEKHLDQVLDVFKARNLVDICHLVGRVTEDHSFIVSHRNETVYSAPLAQLNRAWSELTYRMQALRDNPVCAAEEYDALLDTEDPGMRLELTFDPAEVSAVAETRPRMAILREQGINGQVEMAAAFDRAGFESIDVHMTDLIEGRTDLSGFAGLVACGGFSYGDVLGAGAGWAKSILYHPELKEMFAAFFARPETFALGVCNGCQMISQLKSIIPGAEHWPAFTKNKSEQFEARYVTVEIMESPSILFKGMAGSRLPIPVAHGEGFANFAVTGSADGAQEAGITAVRYVDNYGQPAVKYPLNPNGSEGGLTGLTTTDGRVTVMMPHPERVFRSCQLSYRPDGFCDGEDGPWMKMFRNAREFVG